MRVITWRDANHYITPLNYNIALVLYILSVLGASSYSCCIYRYTPFSIIIIFIDCDPLITPLWIFPALSETKYITIGTLLLLLSYSLDWFFQKRYMCQYKLHSSRSLLLYVYVNSSTSGGNRDSVKLSSPKRTILTQSVGRERAIFYIYKEEHNARLINSCQFDTKRWWWK